MSARKVFWLKFLAAVWTLSTISILVVDAVDHTGMPVVTMLVGVAGIVVYYAIAIAHRV